MRSPRYLVVGFLALLLVGCAASDGSTTTVKLFKSASCGCCVGWKGYMEKAGYEVTANNRTDMQAIKHRYGVPHSVRSCHTAVAGDYVVEGHVPLPVIERLLAERPDIDGIALPNMPAGSPGMPGRKNGKWTIYAFKNGTLSKYAEL